MSIAIGTTSLQSANPSSSSGGSAVALQAQLDRCSKQLSDWVNCSSGKTPQGKQIIEALQEKIGSLKQQIQQQASGQSAASASAGVSSVPASLSVAAIGSVGTILDTSA